jgi:hypothetical protein
VVVVHVTPLPVDVIRTGFRHFVRLALHLLAEISLAFQVLFASRWEIVEWGCRSWGVGGIIRPISLVVVLIILIRGAFGITRGPIQTFAILECGVSFAGSGKLFGSFVDLCDERGCSANVLPSVDLVNDIRGMGSSATQWFGVAPFLF